MDARSPETPESEGTAEEVKNPRIFRDGGWWGTNIPGTLHPERSSIALFREREHVVQFLEILDAYTAETAQANAAEARKKAE